MTETKPNPWKPLLEWAPLLVFFGVNAAKDIYAATLAFMVVATVALVATWRIEGRIAPSQWIVAAVVLFFGGLTLILHDETFIQLKPTVVNLVLSAVLLGGLASGRSLLQPVLGSVFELTPRGWRILTLRWALFFLAAAGVNEVARHELSLDHWVTFKVFGFTALAVVFSISQLPLMKREGIAPAGKAEDETDPV